MEKGGFTTALAQAGLTAAQGVGCSDEMRVGLRGTTRRVWGRRGVKVRQRLQLQYDWCYLVLIVDPRRGKLWWTWTQTMRAEELVDVVRAVPERTDKVLKGSSARKSRILADPSGTGVPIVPPIRIFPVMSPLARFPRMMNGSSV